jgi:hypothetical protein
MTVTPPALAHHGHELVDNGTHDGAFGCRHDEQTKYNLPSMCRKRSLATLRCR